VVQARSGEFKVDLGRFGWFPSVSELRNREGDIEGEDDSLDSEM
jgi:hypothetical protein